MKINNKEVKTIGKFAYDGCHKIYILEDEDDLSKATEYGYSILDNSILNKVYQSSCPLRFIENWKLNIIYVAQGQKAIIKK